MYFTGMALKRGPRETLFWAYFGPRFGPSFEAKSTATQVETKDLPSQNGPHFEALFWGYPPGAYPGSLDPGMGPNPNGLGKQAQTP